MAAGLARWWKRQLRLVAWGLFLFCPLFCPVFCWAQATLPAASDKHEQTGQTARWSQLADTVFHHYTTEQGLPHGVVTATIEDPQGFLWVGTQGGLTRWDGYRFRTYLQNSNDIHSLPDNFAQSLHIDQQGRLWVGTLAAGLARYDSTLDRFIRIGVGEKGVSHAQVNALADDGQGGIWAGTNSGLDHIEQDGARITHIRAAPQQPGALPDDYIRALLRDNQGRLWVGTRKGLFVQQGKDFVARPMPIAQDAMPQIRALFQSQDGNIWIGTIGRGAFVLTPDGSVREIFEAGSKPNAPDALSQNIVSAIAEAEPGQIWLGTYGQGIVVVDGNTLQTRRLRHDSHIATSLPSNTILSFWRDRSGLLWSGNVRGLSRYNPNQKGILTLYGGVSRPQHLSESDAATVSSMPDGTLWLGLFGDGMNIVDAQAKAVSAHKFDQAAGSVGLPSVAVTAISQPVDNTIFIATMRGLYRLDNTSGKLRKLQFGRTAGNEAVREMLLEGQNLWLGSEFGLWRLNLADAQRADEGIAAEEIRSLSKESINVIVRGPDEAIWIGSRNNGLFRYDPRSKLTQQFSSIDGDPASLGANKISSLYFDQNGQLWIGTLGGGVNVLPANSKQFRVQRIGNEQGLRNLMIGKLLGGKDGFIWASTAIGIARIDPRSLQVREMQRADGSYIPSYWVNSGAVTQQGELIFGGLGGISVIRPSLLRPWQYLPPVVITNIQVGTRQLAANRYNEDGAAGSQAAVQLTPDENSIAVEFSALDYSAPERNQYEYKLNGYDKEWIRTDATRRVAAYTNLPPGSYQLQIRGTNRNGEWARQERTLPIIVRPAWHQTWWFVMLQLILGALAIAALVQGRTKYLRQRQQELAQQVAERTQELRQKQEQLVAANQDLHGANEALNLSNHALNNANRDLAVSVDTLRYLGDIGRDITANLDAQIVFQSLYLYVDGLLDAPFLAIYRMNDIGNGLELVFGREDDNILPNYCIVLQSPVSNVARVARERTEMLLNFDPEVQAPSHLPGTRTMLSALYAPLIVGDQLLGVMSIQSSQTNAYGERERLIFRTLSSYGAIALANARALDALQQAQAQLVQQEKLASLGGLVAGIAHEINTPLGTTLMAISGAAEEWQQLESALSNGSMSKSMLETSTRNGAEFTSVALRAAQRAAELINTFKTIAVHAHNEPSNAIELLPYLTEMVSMVHTSFALRGCQIDLQVPSGLTVQAVGEELSETLMRVFTNVLDHAFSDGRQGRMLISARTLPGAMVEIEINDNGHGIASPNLGKVFDPFFTTKSGAHGHVGLGLHVAFNHVTQGLGGSIRINSTEGVGTTVTIWLPGVVARAQQ